ncbi:hypothetical protein PHLCEN_2v7995 [Hermanssonia centrifuga]|uniref:Uncharacterized protein n=1 Tax=Hermanssonia centrifuga TaxID=98765 RepID=A0A2R6NV44_9APHY|nr:hypothetical protein PHLCEN_2v7995 [Hermanssonia centrifuga]
MEHEINKWRQTPSAVGRLDRIQDSAISNGGKFFDNSPERDAPKEPQVAITLGFDGLTPGPKELNADELQFFMKAFVNDLLKLYNHGILVKTANSPEGVTKMQWFEIWIKGNALRESTEKAPRELDAIHTYLKAFEMPSWVARLPKEVGYPAGGSLTSDEWKAMLLLYCPLVIPIIWKEWGPAAEREYQVKLDKWQKKKGDKPAEPKQRMQPENTDNFLNLATAMKILLVQSISINDIPLAKLQLQNYLRGFQSDPKYPSPSALLFFNYASIFSLNMV